MEKNGIFICRIDKGIIHTNIPLTDVVHQEVISGPFIGKDDSVFTEWAPALDDEAGIERIMDRIYQEWEGRK